MLSVEEALDRILSFFHILEPEDRPILDALGQGFSYEEIRLVRLGMMMAARPGV